MERLNTLLDHCRIPNTLLQLILKMPTSRYPYMRTITITFISMIWQLSALLMNFLPKRLLLFLCPSLPEIQWFVFNSHLYNGTRITKPSKVMIMTTDASHSGWGVVCDGVPSSGLWSSKEQAMHINWLELCSSFRCEMFSSFTQLPRQSIL